MPEYFSFFCEVQISIICKGNLNIVKLHLLPCKNSERFISLFLKYNNLVFKIQTEICAIEHKLLLPGNVYINYNNKLYLVFEDNNSSKKIFAISYSEPHLNFEFKIGYECIGFFEQSSLKYIENADFDVVFDLIV